ncbi:hypothetical protein [Paenibacillus glycanilyticus]|uniref:Uncharacterized protein n=1 Tax=Paenibacillus glycanilyticus TaxID=126569 RepID=A0ABQ6GCM3_9BACL|nr:hypothetical protein [Paenibacillus glycanilyticus]GLX68684.1 hypothetical protein MU1_30290 [Paenibacillus glycanilyticus]
MAGIFAVVALAAGAIWLEAPGLIHRHRIKELVMFLALLLIGSVLYSALMLQINLPNPFMLLKWMYGWIGK